MIRFKIGGKGVGNLLQNVTLREGVSNNETCGKH